MREKIFKKAFILLVLTLVIANGGCKKDSSSTSNAGVPNVAVNFTADILTDPQFVNLTVVGGWMYVTGGYLNHGIILYRATQAQFYAMDRTCTYNNSGYVTMEKGGIFAIDSTCGSVFTISVGGLVNKGPATISLKQYQTNFDDGEHLTVSN